MGLWRRKYSFAKVRGFGGSDVLPGTHVDVFYLGLTRNMRENTSKYEELRENFGTTEKDKLHAQNAPISTRIYIGIVQNRDSGSK